MATSTPVVNPSTILPLGMCSVHIVWISMYFVHRIDRQMYRLAYSYHHEK